MQLISIFNIQQPLPLIDPLTRIVTPLRDDESCAADFLM
jgi:hypothetical protein